MKDVNVYGVNYRILEEVNDVRFIVLLVCLLLSSCTTVKTERKSAIILYDHIIANPPEDLVPPPDIDDLKLPMPSNTYDDSTKVYVGLLIDYEEYVGRYIDKLYEANKDSLKGFARRQGCENGKIYVNFNEKEPRPPPVPTVTEIEHDESGYLLFKFVKDLEEWVEDLGEFNDRRLAAYQLAIKKYNDTCER